MAASPYGGYTPANYGAYGGYQNGYGPNMYQSPVAQQLTRMENQYPQYGQTMQPQQYQQGQPNGQPMQNMQQMQQPQQMEVDMSPLAFAVMSEQEARNHPGFMVNGRRHLYYNESDPDKVYMRYFDMGNNGQDVFRVGTFSTGEQSTTPTETPPKEAEPDKGNYLTHEDLKPLQEKIEGIDKAHEKIFTMLEGLEEKLNAKPGSNSETTSTDDSRRSTDDTAGGTNDGDGSKSGRNGKKPVAADSATSK